MATQKGMSDYTIPYDGVNTLKLDVQGDFFHVQSVSVGGTSVFLRFDEGKLITRSQGEGNRVYYSRVEVSASAACNIVLQLGYGYATDARATVNATITAPISPASTNPAQPAVTINAGTQNLILAADGNSVGCIIALDSTQPNGIWVGDNTAAVNEGVFIEPGQTLPIPSKAAIYGFNAGAANVKVSVLKLVA